MVFTDINDAVLDKESFLDSIHTFAQAKKSLASHGISLTYSKDYNEYRMNKGNREARLLSGKVNWSVTKGNEATAYYTDDLLDAVSTAYAQYIKTKA